MERAEALASLVSTATILLDPPQLNAIRYAAVQGPVRIN